MMKMLTNKGKQIAMEMNTSFERTKRMKGKSVKWTEVFETETDIVEALKQIPYDVNMMYVSFPCTYRGYEYIHSFARTVQNGNSLSEAQMKQAKRIATQIKVAYEIRNEWREQ